MQELHYWLIVIFPVFLGSCGIAFINVIKRHVMKGGEASTLQFLIFYFYAATAVFAVVYLTTWGPVMPTNLLEGFWRAVLLGSLANIIIQWANVKAASLDKGEVSLTAPLQAMTPGLITILALTLGEYPSPIGIAGIFLMASGSYVLLFEKTPSGVFEFLGPIARLRLLLSSNSSAAQRNKALVVSLALLSACMGTFGLLFDGLYTRRGVNLQGLIMASMSLTAILATTYLVWYKVSPDTLPHQNPKGFVILAKKFGWFLVVMGILWVAHVFLIQPTFKAAMVAHVGTLKRFQIAITFFLGIYLFGEAGFKGGFWKSLHENREVRNRALACVLIILGAFFLSVDGLPNRVESKLVGWGF